MYVISLTLFGLGKLSMFLYTHSAIRAKILKVETVDVTMLKAVGEKFIAKHCHEKNCDL